MGQVRGLDKVREVSEHVNVILRYVPYVQTSFLFGLDIDEGPEPFELTKRFVALTPGAYPSFQFLTAFGRAAPLNLDLQRANRVLSIPFHVLDNTHATNVRPKNYTWLEFYDLVIDLATRSLLGGAMWRRFGAGSGAQGARWLNLLRSLSSGGLGWIRHSRLIRRRIASDRQVRGYFEQETTEVPRFYEDEVRMALGRLWDWLPAGAMKHDPNAYLKASTTTGDHLSHSSTFR
jgi:hypothetical protein